MSEYTCSCCGNSFDESEKELSQDENKCILHCNKQNIKYSETFNDKFALKFSYYSKNLSLIKDIHFPKKYTLPNINKNLIFEECHFYGVIVISKYKFKECLFYKNINIVSSGGNNSSCVFENSTLIKNILFSNTRINERMFKNPTFSETTLFIFQNTKFHDFNYLFSIFSNLHRFHFHSCSFENEVLINKKKHVKKLSFHKCEFINRLEIISCVGLSLYSPSKRLELELAVTCVIKISLSCF